MIARVRFRHRALPAETVLDRHTRLSARMSLFPAPWGLRGIVPLDVGETGASADLTPMLGTGVAGAIHYIARVPALLEDRACADDVLVLEFDKNSGRLLGFVETIFLSYVDCFDAYRAALILDDDLDLQDADRIADLQERSSADVDGRDSVFRFWSANYFDRQLCVRAFGVEPQEVAARVGAMVDRVDVTGSGVLIVARRGGVSRVELEAINSRLHGALVTGQGS